MASKSRIAADARRRVVVARHAERRALLRGRSVDPALSPEERSAAMAALHRLPRDASPVRLRNRDAIDGRPRGYLRRFGLSRIRVRELAHRGELPGVTTSSW
nr:30S ribosomal protein S14 [Propionicimonas sp.]